MTYWLIFPAVNEAAIRAAYRAKAVRGADNPDEDEKIGVPVANADGSMMFTGTSRLGASKAAALIAENAPWLTVTDDPSFFDTWEWPIP